MKHSNFVQFLHLITVVPRSFLFYDCSHLPLPIVQEKEVSNNYKAIKEPLP